MEHLLFDDTGFSDFGCYGSPSRTPTIAVWPQRDLRLIGFHTTAMCSTTRAAVLTGRLCSPGHGIGGAEHIGIEGCVTLDPGTADEEPSSLTVAIARPPPDTLERSPAQTCVLNTFGAAGKMAVSQG